MSKQMLLVLPFIVFALSASASTSIMKTPDACVGLSNLSFSSGAGGWCEAYLKAADENGSCDELGDVFGGGNDNGSSPKHVCLGIRQALRGENCEALGIEGGRWSYNSSPRDICTGFKEAQADTGNCARLPEEWGDFANTSSPKQVCQGVRAALKGDVTCSQLPVEYEEGDATSSPKQICEGLTAARK